MNSLLFIVLVVAVSCAKESLASQVVTVCEDFSATIQCPGEVLLSITSALYGRADRTTCPKDGKMSNVNCASDVALRVVQEKCDGKNSCTVRSSNAEFGDPCYLTYKYLQIVYTCRNQNARCVSDCTDKPNGDYQSCEGCNVYVTCSNGILHPNRPCPANLVWDDNLKRCEWTSTTCGDCVDDCTGMENGDYQSCQGCHVYGTCSNEILHDNRPCPAGLVWDDQKKRCEWTSTTCEARLALKPEKSHPKQKIIQALKNKKSLA